MKSQGLGKGLGALIIQTDEQKAPIVPAEKNKDIVVTKNKISSKKSVKKIEVKEVKQNSNPEYQYIPVNSVEPNPYQPRKEFEETAIDDLANAISKSGFITPLLVTPEKDGKYVLVAGERRLRACKKLGLYEVPVIVKKLDDAQMMQIAIIENVQRKNLNPVEEAKAYENMQIKLKMDAEEIAKSVGMPHYYVVQKLKLNLLPDTIQKLVANGELVEGSAICLLKLESAEAMIAAAKIAIRQRMTRVSIEKLVDKILLSKGITPKGSDYYFRTKYQYLADAFKDNLGWNMKIKGGSNGTGKIEIDFSDEKDLKDIYKKLEEIL